MLLLHLHLRLHWRLHCAQLWGFVSGVEKTSPRTEVPICIDMPLMNGTSALIVGDYKLLLGHQVSKKSTAAVALWVLGTFRLVI